MPENQEKNNVNRLQLQVNHAVLINIVFFVVLLIALLLKPVIGFLPSVLIVGIAFIFSVRYLRQKKNKQPK
ncbi:MAG: hypothetical protein GX197_01715 [Firmicutes bacterium]|nr:hypothetical protein [Bacillota bacterium]